MHDQMFARSILQALDSCFGPEGFAGTVTVTVELAPVTHVTEDQLRSAFNSLNDTKRYPDVVLAVEHKSLEVKCGGCATVTSINGPIFSCPSCGSGDLTLLHCDEFAVKSIAGTSK